MVSSFTPVSGSAAPAPAYPASLASFDAFTRQIAAASSISKNGSEPIFVFSIWWCVFPITKIFNATAH